MWTGASSEFPGTEDIIYTMMSLMVKSGALVNILTTLIAPIAQWIERCPPEAKTRVRVAVGVLKNAHSHAKNKALGAAF